MKMNRIVLLVLAAFASVQLVQAGTHTWSGAVNSSWSNPGNWSSGGAPQLGEASLALVFPASPTRSAATNDVGNLSINTINVQGDNYVIGGTAVTLLYNGIGASILCSGTNHQIALTLTLSAAGLSFSVGNSASLTLRGTLSGTGSFTKYGYGKLTLAGALDNTYAGVTKVLGGELDMNQGGAGAAIAIPGDLVVGSVGNQNTIYVYHLRDNQVADTATVTVRSSSYFGLYGHSDSIGHLVLDGGYILTDRINPIVNGKLTLLGDVSVLSDSQSSSTIGGHVSLGGATRTFDVTNGAYLTINSDLSDGAGTGGIIKSGGGTLNFFSSLPSSYSGTTTVSGGVLELNNTGGAIAVPGALVIGDDVSPSGSSMVQAMSSNQIAATAPVMIHSSGVLDLSSVAAASQNVGSLTGGGLVQLGVSSLTTSNTTDAQYTGKFTGTGSLIKQGTGKLLLGGYSDQFTGNTMVNGGTLNSQNGIPFSQVAVNAGGNLMGDGLVGNVSSTGGMISPGCCPGFMKLGSKNLSLDAASTFPVQLNGTAGGLYSQLAVVGTVNLGGATLQATLGFNSAISNKFTVIDNDSNDPVGGTFKNLPEGATLVIGGAQFQISYQGGNGNDVVLTQISAITQPQFSGISKLPDGSIQLPGTGLPNTTYTVQVTENLTPPVQWSDLGTTTTDANGLMTFVAPAAPNHPMRFYRLMLPSL